MDKQFWETLILLKKWRKLYGQRSTAWPLDKNPQHLYWPESPTLWCEYLKLKTQNQKSTFTHTPAFDDDTAKILKPIYGKL